MLVEVPKYTTSEILDKVEQFSNRPDDRGRYPSDEACDRYQKKLQNLWVLVDDSETNDGFDP